MGLDFTLYKKKKNEEFDYNHEDDYPALAYGRKSWELVRALATTEDINRGWGILRKSYWDALLSYMNPIGDKLEMIQEAFAHEDNAPEDYPEFIFTTEDKKLIAEYEYWYKRTFDDYPDLGYQFSVGYMLSFWRARNLINEILNDPNSEYEVYMCISY